VAVPKRKTPRSRRNSRRANHDKVSAPNLIPCPHCGDVTVPHRVCGTCGYYKGKEVVPQATSAEG
jgi:large subunit ribosomal protein L32